MACSLVAKLVGKGDQQGIQVPWLDTRVKAYWGACSLPPSSYQVPWGPGLGMGPRIPQRYCMEHKECKQFPAPQARDSSLYTDPPCVTGGHLGNSPRHRAMTQGLASQRRVCAFPSQVLCPPISSLPTSTMPAAPLRT